MTVRRMQVSSRKQPKQARSNELVAAILDAALIVLTEEGAHRFTTARVAERAGVSVGSLYQYFPNKASILFKLQSDEWRRTAEMLGGILADTGRPPFERMRELVHAFMASECEEAAVRMALDDSAPLYRDAPEAREGRRSGEEMFRGFVKEMLPDAADETLRLHGDMLMTTLTASGRQFSGEPRSPQDIAQFSDAMSDMFIAHFDALRAT